MVDFAVFSVFDSDVELWRLHNFLKVLMIKHIISGCGFVKVTQRYWSGTKPGKRWAPSFVIKKIQIAVEYRLDLFPIKIIILQNLIQGVTNADLRISVQSMLSLLRRAHAVYQWFTPQMSWMSVRRCGAIDVCKLHTSERYSFRIRWIFGTELQAIRLRDLILFLSSRNKRFINIILWNYWSSALPEGSGVV